MPALNGDQLPTESRNWGRPGYGPNPKEGTQGMLFSNAHAVNKETRREGRTGDEPGHKGYSVNRLNAVREALPVHTTSPSWQGREALRGMEAAHPEAMEDWNDGTQVYPESMMGPARDLTAKNVHDVVARSTAPIEDVQQAKSVVSVRDMGTIAGGFDVGTRDRPNVISVHAPDLERPRSNEGANTVIHELGHGVSHENELALYDVETHWDDPVPVPGRSTMEDPFHSPGAAARSEGFADAYMEKHSRERGGAETLHVGDNPYHSYTQRGWEDYAGRSDTVGESAPEEYRKSLEMHGGRQANPPVQGALFDEGEMELAHAHNHNSRERL